MKIIAILRGVRPEAVIETAECLLQCGINTLEVPLNSPNALQSIRLLHERYGSTATIGAGTVLTVEQVEDVARAGAVLVLSPNMNVDVIQRTRALGITSIPGVATVTEAFCALNAGATGLKLFPANVLGAETLKSWRSVMSSEVPFYAVGGIDASNATDFFHAGAAGVGVGGWLYQPGRSLDAMSALASQLVASLQQVRAPFPCK